MVASKPVRRCVEAVALIIWFIGLALVSAPARALIMVGRGNAPVTDHNWPFGALEVANLKTRVGWWEGPPFGGGQWHFQYRGDTAAFQEALDLFAKIRAPELRLIVHEGPAEGQFLKDERDPKADAHYDWSLTLWDPRSFNALYNNPESVFSARDPSGAFRSEVDPPILEVYVAPGTGTGSGIDWKAIKVPAGMTVTDERASAAGYAVEDGSVLRGDVYDLLTSKPVPDAKIVVAKQAQGGGWEKVAETQADILGHFELKKAPIGSFSVIASAPDYVDRSLGYITISSNMLKQYTVKLTAPASIKGTVRDTAGKPMADVKLRADNTMGDDGRGYILANAAEATTDAQGEFEITGIPQGHLQIFASRETYQQMDVLHLYTAPASNIALVMTGTGIVKGKVTKPDGSPAVSGNVSIDAVTDSPSRIGTWGGGMNIRPDGTYEFKNVPPGTYTITTEVRRPGETSPNAKTIKVEMGQTVEMDLVNPR